MCLFESDDPTQLGRIQGTQKIVLVKRVLWGERQITTKTDFKTISKGKRNPSAKRGYLLARTADSKTEMAIQPADLNAQTFVLGNSIGSHFMVKKWTPSGCPWQRGTCRFEG